MGYAVPLLARVLPEAYIFVMYFLGSPKSGTHKARVLGTPHWLGRFDSVPRPNRFNTRDSSLQAVDASVEKLVGAPADLAFAILPLGCRLHGGYKVARFFFLRSRRPDTT